ncbi:abscisic acid 8'-hydroxylase 2-like isoform X1 [Magnolia sinica]|uniref:abscisic acid 8'-hydroxylase 2-like isoform X1 n=1 Tax=Magnolia sinica TaxID=86752 RepID=UPI00265A3C91|nr:abscisic acid 8'-hydroxylase 2-like isoform X1 [Magnolia sinica]
MQAFNLSPPLSFLLLCILLFFYFFRFKWTGRSNPKTGPKRLPPGSMGWPYIGETLKLYTQNPNTFFSNKLKRYGDIFKTHILGCPCIMISSPEAAKIVLVSRAHLFKPTYPSSKEKMIGPQAIFFQQGDYHSRLKKLVQASFLPSSIRGSVSDIETLVLKFLPSWENNTINTLHEMKRFAFDVAMLSVFGPNADLETDGIKELYRCLERGYNSMPLNLPGTSFHKAMKILGFCIEMQARKLLQEMLRTLIEKRREEKKESGGLLGVFLGSKYQKLLELNDTQVADNIIGVIFAAHDTTASVLTWILKYLSDNRDLLDSVTKEHEDIQLGKIKEKRGRLTWDDTRKMTLTNRVIQETLRAASVLSFTFREAVEDVELQGYVIPRGWKVLPLFRTIHHSPSFFPHPEKFDPSRFEVAPRPNTFMPFGNGVHSCPGSELAKLEMLVLLHHLTTKYRWEVVGDEDGIQYGPFPVPKHGLPIRVTTRKMDGIKSKI